MKTSPAISVALSPADLTIPFTSTSFPLYFRSARAEFSKYSWEIRSADTCIAGPCGRDSQARRSVATRPMPTHLVMFSIVLYSGIPDLLTNNYRTYAHRVNAPKATNKLQHPHQNQLSVVIPITYTPRRRD